MDVALGRDLRDDTDVMASRTGIRFGRTRSERPPIRSSVPHSGRTSRIASRLTRAGPHSVAVSLPKSWLDRHGMARGDTVWLRIRDEVRIEIEPKGTSDPGPVPGPVLTFRAGHSTDPEVLARTIFGAYVVGCERIRLRDDAGFDPACRLKVEATARSRLGVQVVISDSHLIALQIFLNPRRVKAPKIVARSGAVVDEMGARLSPSGPRGDPGPRGPAPGVGDGCRSPVCAHVAPAQDDLVVSQLGPRAGSGRIPGPARPTGGSQGPGGEFETLVLGWSGAPDGRIRPLNSRPAPEQPPSPRRGSPEHRRGLSDRTPDWGQRGDASRAPGPRWFGGRLPCHRIPAGRGPSAAASDHHPHRVCPGARVGGPSLRQECRSGLERRVPFHGSNAIRLAIGDPYRNGTHRARTGRVAAGRTPSTAPGPLGVGTGPEPNAGHPPTFEPGEGIRPVGAATWRDHWPRIGIRRGRGAPPRGPAGSRSDPGRTSEADTASNDLPGGPPAAWGR